MTDKQSEALRIADLLGKEIHRTVYVDVLHQNSINELRRLHEINTELVEALKLCLSHLERDDQHINALGKHRDHYAKAKAALAKAQRDNND